MLVALRVYIIFIFILAMTVLIQPAMVESSSNSVAFASNIEIKKNNSTDQMISLLTFFLGIPLVIFLLRKQKPG